MCADRNVPQFSIIFSQGIYIHRCNWVGKVEIGKEQKSIIDCTVVDERTREIYQRGKN